MVMVDGERSNTRILQLEKLSLHLYRMAERRCAFYIGNSVLLLNLYQKTANFQTQQGSIGTKRLRIAWVVLICCVGMAVPLIL